MYCKKCGFDNKDYGKYCKKCGSLLQESNIDYESYYGRYDPFFQKWHIENEIGEGSFGKVYKIYWEDFGTKYEAAMKAITIPKNQSELKSIASNITDNKNVSTYFEGMVNDITKEFEIMSKLKGHSHIVSYEDHNVFKRENEIGWDIFIRMELLTPLLDYEKSHDMTEDVVIKLGIDICKALELCSEYNIIHRDIKPENIFVTNSGDFKLGDFGIARTIEKTMSNLSQKGTYTYMAPEVFKNESYGPTVDMYSLGLVMYRYLNNKRPPFLSENERGYKETQIAITDRMSGKSIPKPCKASDNLSKIILKACSYNPGKRFKNCTLFRKALEELVNDNKAEHTFTEQYINKTVDANEDYVQPQFLGSSNGGNIYNRGIETDNYKDSGDFENQRDLNNFSRDDYVHQNKNISAKMIWLFLVIIVILFVSLAIGFGFLVYKNNESSSQSNSKATVAAGNTTVLTTNISEPITTNITTNTTTVKSITITTADPYKQKVYPQERLYRDEYYVSTVESNLSLRCGPGKKYAKVIKKGIPKNEKVIAYAYDTDNSGQEWAFVYYNGNEGWCMRIYLDSNPEIENNLELQENNANYWVVTVIVPDLRFRAGPSQSSRIIEESIPVGTQLEVFGDSKKGDKWVYVYYKNQYGWIMAYDEENPYLYWEQY